MLGFLQSTYKKIKASLRKTRSLLASKVYALFSSPWQESTFEELEKILYEADLGSGCATQFTDHIRDFLKKHPSSTSDQIIEEMKSKALLMLQGPAVQLPQAPPLVILIAGVNGSGKTTTIGKLASLFQNQGKKVLIAAADTFRAAAVEQLTLWAQQSGAQIVKALEGSDPSSVVFDSLVAAKTRNIDVVLIDTAGRLQNKTDLMQELEKIKRVCKKVIPDAPHEVFLILDATTGQNAVDQAQVFHKFIGLTGIILTKLDSSSKGGIALSIYDQMKIPICFIGLGEQMDDLAVFDPKIYVEALFDPNEK